MTWVIVIAGLVALVFIHELGHFSVAHAPSGCGRGASTSASRRRS